MFGWVYLQKYGWKAYISYIFRSPCTQSTQGRGTTKLREADKVIQMKAYILPLIEYHIIFEFGQFLHTLKSLRVHLLLIQWEQINTTL